MTELSAPSILFICTANRYRSPLAEAMLKHELEQIHESANWVVGSAGTWTQDGLQVMPQARRNADRLGIKGLESHLSRQVSADILRNYDLILVMESNHKEALGAEFHFARPRIFLLSEIVDGVRYDIPDPITQPGISAESVATDLSNLIHKGAKNILAQALAIHAAQKP